VLAVLISFLLLGVENIGAFVEEPFHVSHMQLPVCPYLWGP
jgi:predicted membrane chloride channel (bestrophin family)